MCQYCADWKREAPKLFKRWQRAGSNPPNLKDLALAQAGFRKAEEIVREIGAEKLLKYIDDNDGCEIGFEGKLYAPFKLTRADYEFMTWVMGHEISELLSRHIAFHGADMRNPQ